MRGDPYQPPAVDDPPERAGAGDARGPGGGVAGAGRGLAAIRAARRRRSRRRTLLAITTVVTLGCALALVLTFGLRRAPPPPDPSVLAEQEQARAALAEPPLIAIRLGAVYLDGELVASTAAIEESKRLQRVDGLFQALKERRHAAAEASAIAAASGTGLTAIIDVDDDVSAVVVKSVFQTAAYAGYTDVQFKVKPRPAASAGE